MHGKDNNSKDIAKPLKVIIKINHNDSHSQQDVVLVAHQCCIFMHDNQHDLDQRLSIWWTNNLLNWVNTWQPGISASIKLAQPLTAETMLGYMDAHFDHLVSQAKDPPNLKFLDHSTPGTTATELADSGYGTRCQPLCTQSQHT
jgi:hypothetical protein